MDSWEWGIVEDFFSHYRADELPCMPHLREIPSGYQGAVTMRLDCDQAIAPARPLFDLYRDAGLPFSLAVVTGLPPQAEDMALLRDVIAAGGSVVSHSVTHPPNWGADYAQALQEAQDSKRWLEQNLPEAGSVRYAVSPFHQNPPYAVQALADAGYQGFVGGIIHNDPEYLMGRAGRVPFCDSPIVSHSQQCMLHGDCYHRYGNSVAPYQESFVNHLKAGSLFGYLDHPFSTAYQYGWASEAERLMAHAELIQFIRSHEDIWFPNLVQCLDFVRKRDQIQVFVEDEQLQVQCDADGLSNSLPTVAVGWRGETIDLGL
ncbi:MAG: polysaccharide deacetylase family protein [Cyanobacteria bacterium Co-bin13]|nr:polysaccharide deacetylase family protein [Cyanobacteria bacterium Co-bin13]